jgi:site-specific DNA recombinase
MTPRRSTAPAAIPESVNTARPRAAVYCRISQDRTGKMAGIARQEPDCRALAERLGWDVAEVYVDNDVSAYKAKRRPGFERMKDDLRAGRIGAVVCWHPDRLYRRARELEDFVDLVNEVKAEVATVQAGTVDLATPNGRLVARIGASVAQHESEHKGERVKAWHKQRAEAGQPGGGLRPFGYRPDRVTIDRAEAKLIREAAARRLAGESYYEIVRDWNARGLRTVTGRQWTVTSLGGVMRGPRIAGLRQHNGRLHAAVWAAIVDREDWDVLVAMRKDNGVRGRPPKYLLAGLVLCGGTDHDGTPCGKPMSTSHTGVRAAGKVRTYACGGKQTHWHGCGRVAAHAEKVEAVVVNKVFDAFDESPLGEVVAAKAGSGDNTELVSQLVKLEGRLDTLEHEYSVEGLWSKPKFLKRKAELEERIADLSAKLDIGQAVAAGRLPDGIDDLRAWWPDATVEQQRTVIRLVVDHIVIHPAGRGGNVFNEDRVEVCWRA